MKYLALLLLAAMMWPATKVVCHIWHVNFMYMYSIWACLLAFALTFAIYYMICYRIILVLTLIVKEELG